MADRSLLSVARELSTITDSVLVGVSGGKDSVACLDVCCKTIKRVVPFFMYYVPGLSFQEKYLEYLERKFSVSILRIPHWHLSRIIRSATYRPHNGTMHKMPALSVKDCEAHVRAETGIDWIASGIKASDSLERYANIKKDGAIQRKFRRVAPLANWNNKTVFAWLRSNHIAIAPDYSMFRQSWCRLNGEFIYKIRERFPGDYEKICDCFPFARAGVLAYEQNENRKNNEQIPEVRGDHDQPQADQESSVQSAFD